MISAEDHGWTKSFTLAVGRLVVRVLSHGGTLLAVEAPDRDGVHANVVHHYDDIEDYRGVGHETFMGSTIGRYANRIAWARYELDGRAIELTPGPLGEHHLHGGPGGFHTVEWEADASNDGDDEVLRLRRTSPDGEGGHPGNLAAEVEYRLTPAGELVLSYRAETDAPTVVSLTNHAYWNLAGGGPVGDHHLSVAASTYLPTDPGNIPTGERLPVEGTRFDLRKPTPLAAVLAAGGLDCSYLPDAGEAVQGRLVDPASGRVMEVSTDQACLQVFTADNLGLPHRAVCLEAQAPPDAPNQPHLADVVLRPGETYRQRTVHRFSVLSLAVLLACSLAACTGGDEAAEGPRVVNVDGGSESVVAMTTSTVHAAPGDVVMVRNANEGLVPDEGTEPTEFAGSITHLFTSAAPGEAPSVFVPAGGGFIPNPTVWGLCRGGEVNRETTQCPELPIQGPQVWNGRDYWSLGAMLQGEEREVPLAPDIEDGTYRLVCVLHPGLAVDVVVGDQDAVDTEPVGPPADPPPAEDIDVAVEQGEVLAGVVDGDYAYNVFFPDEVTVSVGDTVTWRVAGPDPHDLNFGDRHAELLDSPPSDAVGDGTPEAYDGSAPMRSGYLTSDTPSPGGETFSVTFTEPGSYEYLCRFHETMTGRVIVE